MRLRQELRTDSVVCPTSSVLPLPLISVRPRLLRGRVVAWRDVQHSERLHRTGVHAIEGPLNLELRGAPVESPCSLLCDTGEEREADERGLFDQLTRFDMPPRDLHDLLNFADLVTDSVGRRMSVGDRLDEIPTRYVRQHPVHRAVTRSRSYLGYVLLASRCERAIR